MLLPGFEGPNLNAWGVEVVRKRKFRQGEKAMSRSVRRFLSKNKRVAGMAIGAIAMLAVAGAAFAPETEAFNGATAIHAGTKKPPGTKKQVSFDITWIDPKLKKYFLADRSNNEIEVIDSSTNTPQTPIGHGCFAGALSSSDISGPDGVLTVRRGEDDDEGGVTELWVGDSPGRVWVFNAV